MAISRQASDTIISTLTSQVEESERLSLVSGHNDGANNTTHVDTPVHRGRPYKQAYKLTAGLVQSPHHWANTFTILLATDVPVTQVQDPARQPDASA
jgi:hypothetical protein